MLGTYQSKEGYTRAHAGMWSQCIKLMRAWILLMKGPRVVAWLRESRIFQRSPRNNLSSTNAKELWMHALVYASHSNKNNLSDSHGTRPSSTTTDAITTRSKNSKRHTVSGSINSYLINRENTLTAPHASLPSRRRSQRGNAWKCTAYPSLSSTCPYWLYLSCEARHALHTRIGLHNHGSLLVYKRRVCKLL